MEHRCRYRRGQTRGFGVRGGACGAPGAYGKAVAKLVMTTVPQAKTSRAPPGGWLIVGPMFRFAVSLAPAAAGALSAAQAQALPGGKRG